ncbi:MULTISPECIES: hypothetical protein [unclassified Microcoleus]|uniref:hypothetical protein n=1 Tax=unclassified Microcoleus TaxID=2642155 RepID=UPI002FD67A44
MLSKSYRDCTITPQDLGFLIQFPSGAKVLIKDAKSFEDCQKWIDRQLAHLAIEKALGNQ